MKNLINRLFMVIAQSGQFDLILLVIITIFVLLTLISNHYLLDMMGLCPVHPTPTPFSTFNR